MLGRSAGTAERATVVGVTSYLSPLLALPGAVAADEPDSGVAAHYGDPMKEQRQLASGVGFVDLSHRGVVRIGGPDRLTYLHSISTQHVEQLAPGVRTEALILSPNGHVEHHMRLTDDGAAVWATVEPGTAPALAEFLEKMRFLMQVEVADLTDEWAVVFVPQGDDGFAAGGEVLVPRAELAGAVERFGPPAGVLAYEALRIEVHVPRLGVDTDHRSIPNELGWIPAAVHLDKGCYRGQETVARVHNLGRPPRRLVMLHLDGSVDRLPSRGAAVTLDGREVGFVGSSARHFELGPIGLALLKRSVPVDADLLADGVAASQEVVVDPEAGLHIRPALRG